MRLEHDRAPSARNARGNNGHTTTTSVSADGLRTRESCGIAERHMLGAVLHLRAAGAVTAALEGLSEADFTDPQLRHVFAVINATASSGMDVDPTTIVALLIRSGRVPEQLHPVATGLVIDLVCSVPVPASWPHYKALIVAESGRRRAVEAGERISQAALADDPAVAVRVAVSEFQALLEVLA